MHAILIKGFGGPTVLEPGDVPPPVMAANQMLVRVAACGVCGHDRLSRAGAFRGTRLPAVLGHEIAGTVVDVGSLVSRFKIGDRVALSQRQSCGLCASCRTGRENLCREGHGFYGEDLTGGYGELVSASERNAVLLPPQIPFHVGALLSCALGTGYHALLRARAQTGDAIVITAASGGVGIHTVQIAKIMGLWPIAITASADKVARLRSAGAAEVIVSEQGFHQEVRALTRGEGVEAVIEISGRPTLSSSLRCLRPGGRLVIVGNVDPGDAPFNPAVSILKEIEMIGSAHAVMSDLARIVDLVERGSLQPVIAASLPIEQASRAHELLEDRSAVGRVVLNRG